MKNLEVGISETEKGFVVIPADEYSDMAMSIGALLAENEHLKERVGEYKDMFRSHVYGGQSGLEIKELEKERN